MQSPSGTPALGVPHSSPVTGVQVGYVCCRAYPCSLWWCVQGPRTGSDTSWLNAHGFVCPAQICESCTCRTRGQEHMPALPGMYVGLWGGAGGWQERVFLSPLMSEVPLAFQQGKAGRAVGVPASWKVLLCVWTEEVNAPLVLLGPPPPGPSVSCLSCHPLRPSYLEKKTLRFEVRVADFSSDTLVPAPSKAPACMSSSKNPETYTFFFSEEKYDLLFKGSQFRSILKPTEYVCICIII